MALLIHTWDLPSDRRGREEYRLVGQEAIPVVLRQPGAVEFRAYRNPLGASPQVMVQIEFSTDEDLQRFLQSYVHADMLSDLLRAGIRNVRTEVWTSSPVVPRPMRAEELEPE